MVSEYLDRSRSLEELDDLVAKHRLAAAKVAEVRFKTEIFNAITAISEISQIASARIVADSQVVSAQMAANAEIANARLMADVDISISQILKCAAGATDLGFLEIAEDMIKEIGRIGAQKLSGRAKESIAAIKQSAKEAVKRLEEITTQSIKEIQKTAAQTARQVLMDAETAAEKLRKSKLGERTTVTAAQEADEAAGLVAAAARAVADDMQAEADAAIGGLQVLAEKTSKTLSALAAGFEARIEEAWEKAARKVEETLELALGRLRSP